MAADQFDGNAEKKKKYKQTRKKYLKASLTRRIYNKTLTKLNPWCNFLDDLNKGVLPARE